MLFHGLETLQGPALLVPLSICISYTGLISQSLKDLKFLSALGWPLLFFLPEIALPKFLCGWCLSVKNQLYCFFLGEMFPKHPTHCICPPPPVSFTFLSFSS
jgi:hypothetical protein